MSGHIIYIDKSLILDGKLAQLKTAMQELTSFVNKNMPRLLSYEFFLNENESEMTVVAVHPDSTSLEYHLNVGKERFQTFTEYIRLLKIEVYGEVSEKVLQMLNKKAQMLGNGTVTINQYFSGFIRS